MKPIVYEKSDRQQNDSGLNSAYLPKKTTKLEKFIEGELSSVSKQPISESNPKEEKEEIRKKVEQVLGSQRSLSEQEEQ